MVSDDSSCHDIDDKSKTSSSQKTSPSIIEANSSAVSSGTGPALYSTKLSGDTLAGVSSLPSESTIEPNSSPSDSSGSDPSSLLQTTPPSNPPSSQDPSEASREPPSTDPSSGPESTGLSSRSNDESNQTEMGPHPAVEDVTQYIYDERQCLAHLKKLPTVQWFASHLLCTHVDEAHRWLIVSDIIFLLLFKN